MCLKSGKSKIKVHALLQKGEMSGPCMEEIPEIPERKQCLSSVLSIMYSGLTISNSQRSLKKIILASFQFLRRNPLNQCRSPAQTSIINKVSTPYFVPTPSPGSCSSNYLCVLFVTFSYPVHSSTLLCSELVFLFSWLDSDGRDTGFPLISSF